jgi:two-component system, NtrC family, response regulator AtoC
MAWRLLLMTTAGLPVHEHISIAGYKLDFDQTLMNDESVQTIRQGAAERDGEWVDVNLLAIESDVIGGMVVKSDNMRRVLETIRRLGPYKASVLIHGESGTGKELVARALHTLGSVPKGPFVTFNCSNLVEALAESQLFGHIRGAFTDAREDSLGYFRSANGGTLFLDEIGELPLHLQPKLLRAVETHEVQPVGSAHSYKVDIRLIAATNRDLRAMVKTGAFRDDLYYRLNATAILLPPLRDRRDAIEALAVHFTEHYNRLFGKQISQISRRAIIALENYDWPGNVREFAHAIESAAMLCGGNHIDLSSLPDYLSRSLGPDVARKIETAPDIALERPTSKPDDLLPTADAPVKEENIEIQTPLLLDEVIKRTLVRSLEETEGNRRRAADLLGISRSTLYRMLTRYGLADESGRRQRPGPSVGHF